MTIPVLQKSCELYNQASAFIHQKRFLEILSPHGTVYFTGSYLLDLMTWPDIDIQIVLHEGLDPKTTFLKIFSTLYEDPDFLKGQMTDFRGDYKLQMPRGFYLGLQYSTWKVDIWALNTKDFEENRRLVKKIQDALTPEKRALILEQKTALMEKGRVPQGGSHRLYQKVLFDIA